MEENEEWQEITQLKKGMKDNPATNMQDIVAHDQKNSGLPERLKHGIEKLSNMSMADVNVHYNSPKPAQLEALAYTRGNDIHIGPGQERHLPHEAWHVAQQKQGRVKATVQAYGHPINDNRDLEEEADVMGAKALKAQPGLSNPVPTKAEGIPASNSPVQRRVKIRISRLKEDYTRKTKTQRGQKVQELIDNRQKTYYFRSKNEMEAYANGTDREGMGFFKGIWINLDRGLTVLGETHNDLNDKTANAIAKATNTQRYRYEGYTEPPAYATRGLHPELAARQAVMDDKGTPRVLTSPPREGEDFLPKVLRGVHGAFLSGDRLNGSAVEAMLVKWALIYAKGCPLNSALYQYYQANSNVFDATINDLANNGLNRTTLSDTMYAASDTTLWEGFRSAFVNHAMPIIWQKQATLGKKETRRLVKHWQKSNPEYPNPEVNAADKLRDFSMYQYILRARDDGYRLFGIGKDHLTRLMWVLNSAGIKCRAVDDFLTEQDNRHPQ